MKPNRPLGAHMPTAGGLDLAIRNGHAIGCTAVQVFTSSPKQWKSSPVTDQQVEKFLAAREETGIGDSVVSHDSYLINLCVPDPERREQSRQGLIGEMRRCGQLHIPFVVSHMGAHLGEGTEAGLAGVIESARIVLDETPDSVTLLMETTAGQGTSLNSRFEEIAAILDDLGRPARLAVCLDTCHIFAAGYDIRTKETYEATFAEFDRLIGCDQIKVIHCNDSLKGFGTRVDRHAHLGEGEIGPTAFELLLADPRFVQTMIVVETPEAETFHAVNVGRLWEWAGAPLGTR